MPQEAKQAVKARKPRNFVSTRVRLQVLGSGASAAPASVYLLTDHSRLHVTLSVPFVLLLINNIADICLTAVKVPSDYVRKTVQN